MQIVLYGNGALTERILFYNRHYKLFDIVAIIDDVAVMGTKINNIPIMSYEEFKNNYPIASSPKILITIGYTKCNSIREAIFCKIQNDGYQFANYISPRATCWANTTNWKNQIIFDNVFIGPGCTLGNGVVICPGTLLSHDIQVGDFVFFSDGVVVGGNAKIGKNSFIGLNSTIKSSLKIGEKNIVASAGNVIHDSEPFSVLKGNPAVAVVKDTISVLI